jgi:hypothetical protein
MSKKLSHVLLIGVGLFSSTWVMAAVKEYDLTIAEQTVNITGKPLKRITVNGKFVAPLLEFEEGDEAVIRVHNKLKNQDSSIHWHGLLLPGIMDGVPGFNNLMVLPLIKLMNISLKSAKMVLIGIIHIVKDKNKTVYMVLLLFILKIKLL